MTRGKSKSVPADSSGRRKHGINDLPDSILGQILSFLPAKIAAATTILSKRWKFLWTTVSNLDFCFPESFLTGSVDRFVQFVNYVLLLHKPSYFNKLSISWKKRCSPFHVNTWICAAVARDVHELIVRVDVSRFPIHVQSCMFTNERLKFLELNCSICITPEFVVSLPRLETLKLFSIYFMSEEAFCKLLDGCPVLNHLVIHMDFGKMLRCGYFGRVDGVSFKCRISSTSLKHLELCVYDKFPTRVGRTALCGVQLDAPFLRYIKLEARINSIFLQERLNFLGEANIQLTHFQYIPMYCNSFVEALDAFACAKTLNLSDEVIRALTCATIKMGSRFTRLKRLEVTIYWNYWSSLQDFIELSDNLEVLIVNKDYYDDNGDHFNNSNWTKPNVVPKCLSKSLRTVSIGAFDGYPEEMAMVDYIIKHGSVLEIMQICFGFAISDLKRKYELVQEISVLPRKSTICVVKFDDDEAKRLSYGWPKREVY